MSGFGRSTPPNRKTGKSPGIELTLRCEPSESSIRGVCANRRRPGRAGGSRAWSRSTALKCSLHLFTAWPGFLDCLLHFALGLAGLLRLVLDFIVLPPCHASPILLSSPRSPLCHNALLRTVGDQ